MTREGALDEARTGDTDDDLGVGPPRAERPRDRADPVSVSIRDLNGDGMADLATANESSNTISVLLGNGDGSFGVKTELGTGAVPPPWRSAT